MPLMTSEETDRGASVANARGGKLSDDVWDLLNEAYPGLPYAAGVGPALAGFVKPQLPSFMKFKSGSKVLNDLMSKAIKLYDTPVETWADNKDFEHLGEGAYGAAFKYKSDPFVIKVMHTPIPKNVEYNNDANPGISTKGIVPLIGQRSNNRGGLMAVATPYVPSTGLLKKQSDFDIALADINARLAQRGYQIDDIRNKPDNYRLQYSSEYGKTLPTAIDRGMIFSIPKNYKQSVFDSIVETLMPQTQQQVIDERSLWPDLSRLIERNRGK